jgi:Fe-S cluster biogenesis protein NfuA
VRENMLEQVKEVIDKELKLLLAMQGGDIELVSVENGVVRVRLCSACACCSTSQALLVNFVETILKDRIPEVEEVIVVDDRT